MWLLIALVSILLAILMKINNICSWTNIIFDILRLFTAQDVNISKFNQFVLKVRNRTSTVITIIILIFFTVIITKCFTSLLLTTYFKIVKVPVVNSLEQLLERKQCLIASVNRTILILKVFNVLEDKQVEILRERKDRYEQVVKMDMNGNGAMFDERVFNDMVEGKTIIVDNTIVINHFVEIYERESHRFVVTKHKYINRLASHRLSENSIIKEQQIFGFVSSIFIRLVHSNSQLFNPLQA